MHNLRSALDYIVTALLDKNAAPVTTRHEFPIFASESLYRKKVGTATTAINGGCLQGITDGSALIDQCQPFHRKPDPRADPLWFIHRFNNADKHRLPAFLLTLPTGELRYRFKGVLVEKIELSEIPNFKPDQEYEIAQLRFDPPVVYDLGIEAPLTIHAGFVTPAIGAEPVQSVSLSLLRRTCTHVSTLVELFGQI